MMSPTASLDRAETWNAKKYLWKIMTDPDGTKNDCSWCIWWGTLETLSGADRIAKDNQRQESETAAGIGTGEKQIDFIVASSRKFDKILHETRADSEKSQNYKSELQKWKRIMVFWQNGEGTRAWGHISKWAVTDWKILAMFTSSLEGGWYTPLLNFPNKILLY